MDPLRIGVLLAGVWAVLALAFLRASVKSYGKRTLYSRPAGNPAEGVRYAFTKAMLPWAKESVRTNMISYAAGLTFHAGVFAGFVLLLTVLAGFPFPWLLSLLPGLMALLGSFAGLGLLIKRLTHPELKGFSSPDDYISNLLSSLFALLAFAAQFSPGLRNLWMAEAIVLLTYAPLGKIRHCLFFFTTRYHLGAFFGRRGSFPPGGSHHA